MFGSGSEAGTGDPKAEKFHLASEMNAITSTIKFNFARRPETELVSSFEASRSVMNYTYIRTYVRARGAGLPMNIDNGHYATVLTARANDHASHPGDDRHPRTPTTPSHQCVTGLLKRNTFSSRRPP
ncbi:hypothetical protein EVAR_14380_1 [Eumeta japonica]|uniref:Uncharacterized protein n=1 Tax=Eumeta variegata TaxID=151549 RepID=A0A4C1TX88_EUMVA|nr:hypothetical protein EVAR_14380_1 [Eumeta japonica]